MKKYILRFHIISLLLLGACAVPQPDSSTLPDLKVSENGRYLIDENDNPFFWLGDTGWLLFAKMNREETAQYLDKRVEQGFNVIQVMVLHTLSACNYYGDSALINQDASKPLITEGSDFADSTQYDFWDHVDYVVNLAEEKGLYMALVPVWGNNVLHGGVSRDEAAAYAKFIANRYKEKSNIIWLNGGDTYGSDSTATWNIIGNGLNDNDPNHLITFHPRGRCSSTDWFHNESWMDFNMIQSGHRNYEQDDTERGYGPDNWRFVEDDYNFTPIKPTIDGEPSYEGIPHGLHDTTQAYWNDADVRRYGYWSVFAGAFGYTYGHNAVMQFYDDLNEVPAFGAKILWQDAIVAPGAQQMVHLKDLMLSRPFLERVPDQSLIAGNQGEKYDYLVATRGTNYAMVYTYTGRDIDVALGKTEGETIRAQWFNPRNGAWQEINEYPNEGTKTFNPPGKIKDGNDWVLVLDSY